MSKCKQALCVEDILTTNESRKSSTCLLTQRLPIKKRKSVAIKTFDTTESLQLYYKKLKDINSKKKVKIEQLQETIQFLSSIPSENSTTRRLLTHNSSEKILNSITTCEQNTENEIITNSQLQNMRKRELIATEKLQEDNLKTRQIYIQICAEYNKLKNMTSNVDNMKISAQSALSKYEKLNKSTAKAMKKKLKKKKSEVLEWSEKVKAIRTKSEEKIRRSDEKMQKNLALRKELEKKCQEAEKSPSNAVKDVLKNYKEKFGFVFVKLGLDNVLTKESIDCIIKAYNMYMFRDGSLSERYFQLSQCHIHKIEEFNKAIKELSNITDVERKPSIGMTLPLTYNMQRTQDDKAIKEEIIEKLLLKTYSETSAVGHRILKLILGVKNVANMPSRIYTSYKKLQNLLVNDKKTGRKTLLKAITQDSLASQPNEITMKSKINIAEEYLKHYPKDFPTALTIQTIVKSSPILSFVINTKIFQQFLIISDPLQDLALLIEDCYSNFSGHYSSLIKSLTNVLQDARNCQPDDPSYRENEDFAIRRRAVQVKSCLTLGSSGLNTSRVAKKGPKSRREDQIKLSSIKSIREKLECLRKYQFRAAKSVDVFHKNHLVMNKSQKNFKFTK